MNIHDVPVVKIERPKLNFIENTYLIPIFQGMLTTMRHLLTDLTHQSEMRTVSYPEERKTMPSGYRGKHRLTLRDDGQVKCVACQMCATACPAECIHIVSSEHPDPTIEKFPLSFDIDLLRCIYCGYCVEACPCDAIRMDTGVYTITATKREDFIIRKEQLMAMPVQAELADNVRPKQGLGPEPEGYSYPSPHPQPIKK